MSQQGFYFDYYLIIRSVGQLQIMSTLIQINFKFQFLSVQNEHNPPLTTTNRTSTEKQKILQFG